MKSLWVIKIVRVNPLHVGSTRLVITYDANSASRSLGIATNHSSLLVQPKTDTFHMPRSLTWQTTPPIRHFLPMRSRMMMSRSYNERPDTAVGLYADAGLHG